MIQTVLIDEYSQRILVSDVQHNLSRFEVSILVTPNTYLKGIEAKGEALGINLKEILRNITKLLPDFYYDYQK